MTINGEQRMLIDGALVLADSGKMFDNINPATEEVLGQVADASAAEMHRAIDGARRAFDTTDWSTNHSFRQKCLGQLQEALEARKVPVRWDPSAADGPTAQHLAGEDLDDIVAVDADSLGGRLPAVAEAWRKVDPAPAVA